MSGTACECVLPSGSGSLLPEAPSPGFLLVWVWWGHSFTLTCLTKSSKDSVSGREVQLSGFFSSYSFKSFLHCLLACIVCNEESAVILAYVSLYICVFFASGCFYYLILPVNNFIMTRLLLLRLLSRFSRVRLCETPWTAAHQALPSLGFSRQEPWSGLPLPSPVHESEK